MAGYDDNGPQLYQIDPSGSYFAWKASGGGGQGGPLAAGVAAVLSSPGMWSRTCSGGSSGVTCHSQAI